jgi:hypothetical protein
MNSAVRDNLTMLDGGRLAITSQAAGDVVYASSATALARLGADAGKFLKSGASSVSWDTVAFSSLSPLTTRGDVLYSSSGTVTGTRLAVGAAGTRLGTDGTDVSWVSPTATILQKTAAYTCTVADCGFDALIKCHMTGGAAAFDIDLYAASGNAGRRIAVLKETDDNHIVTVDPNGSDTIANAPGQTGGFELFALGDYVVLTCDGTNWFVESEHQSIHGLVRLNANQTVATGAFRRVNYDTEVFDTFGGWNNAGNYEFTVPRFGYYQISCAAQLDGPNDTSCMTQIRVSNVESRRNNFQNMYGGNLPIGVTLQIDTDQYVQVFSQHNRGTDTELVAGLANTYFSIDYIGQ